MLMRSLLLSSSLSALIMAAPALAQEAAPVVEVAPAAQAQSVQDQSAEPDVAGNSAPADDVVIDDVVEGEEAFDDDGEPLDPEIEVEEEPAPVVAIPEIWAPIPFGADGVSAYGHYLVGRNALSHGDTVRAARQLQAAYELTPEQPRLREQAFTAAILVGDLDFAARVAPQDETLSPVIVEAGHLVKGIQTYVNEGARRANDYLRENPVGMPHDRAAVYAQAWIAADARDWDRALAFPPQDFDPISTLVARGNRARLLEIRRRYDEADAEWQELTSHATAGALFRLPYGEFLERRGRKDEALAIYEAAIAVNQADSRIRDGRARILSKARAPALPTMRQGLAQALRTAGDQMSAQRAHEFAAVYLRLAQNVEPRDQNLVTIGQSLISGGLEQAGRDALGQVSKNNIGLYANARAQRGVSFEKDGMDEEALAEFQIAMDAVPNEPSVAYALAAQLLKMKRYDEALAMLNGPILNVKNQGYDVRFLRGAAYEATGQQEAAEAELWSAYQAAPNNPTILNYLGYLWVDGGKRVVEGAALIARAFAAAPDDGNIQDSLGWAQYKQGQYEQALQNIEQAVSKEPANAEINDHLGDVYWALGRKREAGYQWERVLTLDVDSDRRGEVEAKLVERLGFVMPVAEQAAD